MDTIFNDFCHRATRLASKGNLFGVALGDALSNGLAVVRAAVFATDHSVRLGHFQEVTVFSEGGRPIDLLVGQFRIRAHERPLMKCTRLNQCFQRLLGLSTNAQARLGVNAHTVNHPQLLVDN